MKKEIIGYITVDAGIIQIGDPCYTSEGKNHTENWPQFCKDLEAGMVDGVFKVTHERGTEGKAVVFNTLYGDGIYPIHVKKDKDGRIKQIIIDL